MLMFQDMYVNREKLENYRKDKKDRSLFTGFSNLAPRTNYAEDKKINWGQIH